jgi:hypothetical protein
MKTEKQQTAVEWLAERCGLQGLEDVIAEAKEMEKEQIEELVIATYTDLKMKDCQLPYGMQYHNELLKALEEAKKYYNETFKQQEQ